MDSSKTHTRSQTPEIPKGGTSPSDYAMNISTTRVQGPDVIRKPSKISIRDIRDRHHPSVLINLPQTENRYVTVTKENVKIYF